MKKKIISIMYSSNLGYWFVRGMFEFWHFFSYRLYLSDKEAVKRQFKQAHGYELDLNNPKTLNEKMQWLKIYDRTPTHTLYADKYAVREVFKEKYGNDALVDLLYHTNSWKDITMDKMPDFPFIIKPNHGSGWYHIINDKNLVDWNKIRTDCRYWLSQNAYPMQKEWQYKNIPPCIIVERLLICQNGNIPTNYRVHCFHGKVGLIALTIYTGLDTEDYKNQKYNRDWELISLDWAERNVDLSEIRMEEPIPRPSSLDAIIEIAEDISKVFKYVRVDFFEVDGKVYHGELTFHDGGGYEQITPFEWDVKLGDLLDLNKEPIAKS